LYRLKEEMATFESCARKVLLPCPEFQSVSEIIEWNHLSSDEKLTLKNNVAWDIDFLSIKCKSRVFRSDSRVQILLGSSSGKFFKKCCLNTARMSFANQMLTFAKLGDFLLGMPIIDNSVSQNENSDEEPLDCLHEDDEYDPQLFPSKRVQISHLRTFINSKLATVASGENLTQVELFLQAEMLFDEREIVALRYGQKVPFSQDVENQL
jgi:hypothetical protein